MLNPSITTTEIEFERRSDIEFKRRSDLVRATLKLDGNRQNLWLSFWLALLHLVLEKALTETKPSIT